MSMFTEEQAKAILDKVIKLSKADECTATADRLDRRQHPFRAQQRFHQRHRRTTPNWPCKSAFGKRVGMATINEFDDAALERVVRRAEDLAKLAPENPEFMPAIEKQTYKPSPTFSTSTAAITPEYRAQVAADSIGPCKAEKLDRRRLPRGRPELRRLRQQQGQLRLPAAPPTSTTPARCAPRTAAVRAGSAATSRTRSDFKADSDIRTAMRKATESAEAKALEPGKYTVILEPAAAAGPDLVHDELLRRAPGRRRPQLPVEEGRRQQARRAGLRPAREHQRRSVGRARAGAAVGPGGPAAREDGDRRERQGRRDCSTRASGRRSRASARSASPATC